MQNREDVGQFFLKTHEASVHITDLNGISPMLMASQGPMLGVSRMVLDATRKVANADRKTKRSKCSMCERELGESTLFKCSRFKIARYRGVDCQREHWKNGHREECKEAVAMSAGVSVGPSPSNMAVGTSFNYSMGKIFTKGK